jgi:uncharacterized LabA/DUF88 family protein
MVFIDGQNVWKTCKERYGNGLCHPILIAERLREGRNLKGVRFYTAIHDPHVNPEMNGVLRRRLSLMQKTGVQPIERPLAYRDDWGVRTRGLPNPSKHLGEKITVEAEAFLRPREKGIDLALALDVVDLALRDAFDVAVIVSSDADLCEVPNAINRNLTHAFKGHKLSVEAAVFNDKKAPVVMRHYAYTHQLTRNDFDQARDGFNYYKDLDPIMVEMLCKTCESLLH